MQNIFPATTRRVRQSSPAAANRRIDRELRERIDFFREHPEHIEHRLSELDREWDIERVLEANAAALALCGTAMGALKHRAWLTVPLVVSSFLLQHALQGWCPPVPVFRALGVRTAREIEMERQALKLARGDFGEEWTSSSTDELLDAVA